MRKRGASVGRFGTMSCAAALCGCGWLSGPPDPGEWARRGGTIRDFQPHHVATLVESGGVGQLQMSCGEGPIHLSIAPGRDRFFDNVVPVTVTYRLDQNPPVRVTASTNGHSVWLRDAQGVGGEDPLVRPISRSRQLTVLIDWSVDDSQTMRFDTSQTAPAAEWLRNKCVIRHGPRP